MAEEAGTSRRRRPQPLGVNDEVKHEETKKQNQNRTESIGCISTTLASVAAVVSLTVAVLAYAYATSPISSVIIENGHDPASIKWNRKFNSNLQKGHKILTELSGAESIVVDDQGNLYTGLHDGRLVKIIDPDGPAEKVIDITDEVDYTTGGARSSKRPLGLRIFEDSLYLADAYQGVFAINLNTLAWKKLVGYNDVSPPMIHTNDLAIAKNGDVYFTDVCGRWQYENPAYPLIEGRCTGRLFKIGRNSTDARVVRNDLCGPNGIELSRDETKLLVSEIILRRIVVLDARSGAVEKTILLHGASDNIRRSPTGGYWAPVPVLSRPIEKYLARHPVIRDIVVNILGNSVLAIMTTANQGTILKLNEEFEIEQIHQDLDGKVACMISQVQEYQPGKLLLGSFLAPGIVKVDELIASPEY